MQIITAAARMLEAQRLEPGNPKSDPIGTARNGESLGLNNVEGRMILPVRKKPVWKRRGTEDMRRGED